MVNHFPYRLSHLPKPTQQVSCRAGMDRTLCPLALKLIYSP